MSDTVAYEVQSHAEGRWKIQSFFNDRELAVAEADRMDGTKRYGQIRVVEERFDPAADSYVTRTVYRPQSSRPKPIAATIQAGQPGAGRDKSQPLTPAASRPQPQKAAARSAANSYLSLSMKAATIFVAGVAAIYALKLFLPGG